MMHYQSHQARWQYIPLAAPKLTPWQRFCRWLNDLFTPMMLPEARRRIDPAKPYGHWSAGFQPPTLPQAKKSRVTLERQPGNSDLKCKNSIPQIGGKCKCVTSVIVAERILTPANIATATSTSSRK